MSTAPDESGAPRADLDDGEPDGRIAVIGLACRYPGARDADGFWSNLRDGVESISRLPRSPGAAERHTVDAAGLVADIDRFDAALFGYTARDAALLDPQQRLFLECSWEALESAGYDTTRHPGSIGVFAGQASSAYLRQIQASPGLRDRIPYRRLELGNDKDFLATSVAYRLDLRGPAISVQSACSTSLVAVHLAVQSLLNGECDMALAGGVSLRVPQDRGYRPEEGISSPDGHCRAFDQDAGGCVPSGGAGVVVLKPLAAALNDGDSIRAVILGSAVNNDGAARVGYTAPGVEGQTAVVQEALDIAGVDPETVSYVEAHGTGTPLGDMIEVAALTAAYGARTDRRRWCGLGSVKTNIGHADAAAGVAGLIKAVLALENELIPPSLNHRVPNPRIGFEQTPFRVVTSATPWPRTEAAPRRAGVSSFGMGGTNAHLVLEEAPDRAPAARAEGAGGAVPEEGAELLLLSAQTPQALEQLADRIRHFLRQNPGVRIADVAYTLRVGRRALPHRAAVVCRDTADAVRRLRPELWVRGVAGNEAPSVAFVLPDVPVAPEGTHRDPAAEVRRSTPGLARDLAALSALVRAETGLDPATDDRLLLFALQTAAARQLMSWGVVPEAMAGRGVGAWSAAFLSGTVPRTELMRLLASGAPAAHQASDDDLRRLTDAPGRVVVTIGREEAGPGLLGVLADLWTRGAAVAPYRMDGDEHRRRVRLPAYPFARERHWLLEDDGSQNRDTSDDNLRQLLGGQLDLMRQQLASLAGARPPDTEPTSI
ncbi:beta-ketoacyl synthase N-terminal-like domain-containing protein [Streptomyces sp. NPDC001851]|uniref:type I polyketide synthase n=1 Tax=Streptomyces sp. NPDC001851 TaxID=3154529 RepID=UPI00331D49BD